MNVVGVAGGIVLSERSSCARKLAPLPQKLLKKYFTIEYLACAAFPLSMHSN